MANNEALRRCSERSTTADDAIRVRERRHRVRSSAFRSAGHSRGSPPLTVPGVAVPPRRSLAAGRLLVGASAGERVLDACAAPGGKTAYIARSVGSAGRVTAVDPGWPRAAVSRALLEHLPACDARDRRGPDRGSSGRTRPTTRCSWTRRAPASERCENTPRSAGGERLDDLTSFARRQASILNSAARHVRPGGRLVYATCSLSRTENDRGGRVAFSPPIRNSRPTNQPTYRIPATSPRRPLSLYERFPTCTTWRDSSRSASFAAR